MKTHPFIISIVSLSFLLHAGCSTGIEVSQSPNKTIASTDTISSQRFDMGKMWTFDNPPVKYFKEEYNFEPDQQWLQKARMAALKLGNGCSASFVSEDGLIMTNHHCVRGSINSVAKEDENFLRDGFAARTAEDERTIENLFVQQLVLIEDVTEEFRDAMDKGNSDEERVMLRDLQEEEIIRKYSAIDSSLIYKVITFYDGGKYSLYGYKQYDDIRLVFVPDLRTAKPGGDYDNFTYPRHGLDCAFLRAYENGKPAKTPDYFKWNTEGAETGEPIFVIGNPGNTDRIKTMAQIAYDKEYYFPAFVTLLEEIYSAYLDEVNKTKAEDYDLIAHLYSIGNTLKVMNGTLEALNNPVLMARKQDFENKFRQKVNNDPALKEKYAGVWDEIEKSKNESMKYAPEMNAYSVSPYFSAEYFNIARKVLTYAHQLSLPEDSREKPYRQENVSATASAIYPDDISRELQEKILKAQVNFFYSKLSDDNPLLKKILGGRKGNEAVRYLLQASRLTTKEGVAEFIKQTPEQIFSSTEPFIVFILEAQKRYNDLKLKFNDLTSREEINNQRLGQALFEIYGETIPPDATGTLRISDGVIKSYPYNGTIAPTHTTFYGILEKYHSFNKQFPFNLSPLWENLPDEFDLSVPLDFISTNDIIGGNSGSPVINRDLEIIGLAFDGNYESLADRYIYTTEIRRTICVHPKGMLEAINDLYKFKRLGDEIVNGKLKD